jgi:hypothetical protein
VEFNLSLIVSAEGWALAWRSLMAGEISGIVSHQVGLGRQIQFGSGGMNREGALLSALWIEPG